MSKCTDIKEICGDYTFDVEYSADNKFTMFFNSLRNAETVKRCIEVDVSVPNAATAVDFVEVVRCKECAHGQWAWRNGYCMGVTCEYDQDGCKPMNFFCGNGERREDRACSSERETEK